ncbi:PAS domain S-box protein [Leptolyngbya sp. KIOST-1]|uniref:PAS domain S-box protein n=1 Tax=Leptolyngbya sp. KIOST-1 TaxID=1229172 RepID=UPI00068C0DD6|nr:PAS domain S-box protein [Leptolyngbya sp. KIOST-1]
MATILCVDDNALTPAFVEAQLTEAGLSYRMAIATNATEAIAQIEAIDGAEAEVPLAIVSQALVAADWLAAFHHRWPRALVVLLESAGAQSPQSTPGLALLAQIFPAISGQICGYVAQPWSGPGLRLTVVEALRRYRYEQEIAQLQADLSDCRQQVDQVSQLDRQLAAPAPANCLQTAKALRDSEAHRRAILAAVPDVMTVLTDEGQYVDFSFNQFAGELISIDADCIVGSYLSDIFPADLAQQWLATIQLTLATKQPQRFEQQLRFGDRLQYEEVRIVPYQDHWVLAMVRDISDRQQIEAALQQSQEQLRVALEFGQIAIWTWDGATEQVSWNDQAYRLMGVSPGPQLPTYDDWFQAIHSDDRAAVLADMEQAIATQQPFTLEYRVRWPDGTLRWVADRGRGVYTEAGEILRAAGVMYDITARKQAELAQQESERRYRRLLDTANEGVWVVDADSRTTFVNPKMATMLGYTTDEMLGQPVFHFIDEVDWDLAQRQIEQLKQGNGDQLDFKFRHKGGGEVWALVSISPMFDDHQYVGALGMLTDVTARKAAEQALAQTEDRYRRATQASKTGVWELDLKTGFLYVDPSIKATVGYSDAEITPDLENWQQNIHPDDVALMKSSFDALIRGNLPSYEQEYRVQHKDGSLVWMLSRGQLHLDEQGQPATFLGTTTDITDLKQAELALHQLNNELEQRVQERTQELQKLAAIVENSPDLIAMASLEGDLLYLNRAGQRLLDLTPDDIVGNPMTTVLTEVAAAQLEQEALPLVMDQGYWQGESMLRHGQTGAAILAEQALFLVRDPESQAPLCMATIGRDIRDRKRAEQALRESEERFRSTFEQAALGIIETDLNGHIVKINQKFCELLGYSAAELLSKTYMDLTHPSDVDADNDNVRRLLSGEQTAYVLEKRYLHRDGTVIWVSLAVSIVRDGLGRPQYLLGVVHDIRDRKRAEHALRESEERFRATFEQAAAGMVQGNLDGQLVRVNQRFCELLGYTHSELFLKSYIELTHPADVAADRAQVQRLLAGEASSFMMEKRYLRHDRSIVWATLSVSLVRDGTGEPQYFIAVIIDISDRKQTEQALQESRNMMQMVLDTIPQRVFWKDRESRFLGCNPAFAQDYRLTPEQIIGKTDAELPWAAHAPDYRANDIEVMASRIPRLGYEELTTNRNGEDTWIRTSKVPLTNANGVVVGVLGCYEDISDRKQAENVLKSMNQELEQRVQERTLALQQAMETAQLASRAKSTFLANMSHELRTPLNAILGFSQLMARDFELNSDNRQSLDIINRSGEHLLDLINDILEMAKIEAGQVTITPLRFDLDNLLSTLTDLFGLRARDKGLTFSVDRHPALPRYLCSDEPKLRQVLINLVGNAIKFTERGQVCLRVAPVSPPATSPAVGSSLAITFAVSDTGIGIAAENLDRLLEPFVQVNQGCGVYEGTGLGLSISRQFVQLLGGNLTVESQLGQGSTFAFTLAVPVAAGADDLPAAVLPNQIAELLPGQPSYRILVTDDDDIHRRLLTHLLRSTGFEVSEARDGREAIALWQTWQPHLIWLDMRMPMMKGDEVVRHIRTQEQLNHRPTTKIVALTANAFEEDRAQALDSGCDDFVRKPFQLNDILSRLREHLGVQYAYTVESATAPSTLMSEPAAIAALRSLPPDLLRRFQEATLRLDNDALIELIGQLGPDQAPLAELLSLHRHNFAFDVIHSLLRQAAVP